MDASMTTIAAILYQESDYDYKVKYVKGKDNACTDLLSLKDGHKKQPVPTTEELATEIFHQQYCTTSKLSDANPM
uniref:Reverse transcriptase/retrotransposon-derived protein RNase H-like domain-containing protein n=1 Tax=Romanomermis culicivorax TaxID=13658 RepID=A0A915J857_ROMCU